MFFNEPVDLLGVVGNHFPAVAGATYKNWLFDYDLMMQGADTGSESRDYRTFAESGEDCR